MSLASALRAHAMFSNEPLVRKKPRKPKWPHKPRAEYYRDLTTILKRIEAVVQRELIPQLPRIVAMVNITRPEDAPIRNDAPGDEIDGVVATVIARVGAEVDDAEIEMLAQRNVVRTTTWHGNEFQKQVREVAAINVYDDTTGLVPHLELAVSENVRLIKNLEAKTLDEIRGVVLRGARTGMHQSVIAEQIQQQFGMSKRRAALIATDQVGKLNSELNAIRQQRLGVRRYRWSSSQDERVRKRHRQLNGTIQEWAKPPVTDERTGERAHPGQPIRCRCQPIPIIDDVFADAGLIDPSEVELGQHAKETTIVAKGGRKVRYKGGEQVRVPGRAPLPDFPPVKLPSRPPANVLPQKAPQATTEPKPRKRAPGAVKPPTKQRKPRGVKNRPTMPVPPGVESRVGPPPAWMVDPNPRISREARDIIKEKGVNESEILTFATPAGPRKGLWKPLNADKEWTHGMENSEAAAAAFDRLLHTTDRAVVPNTVVRQVEGNRGSLQELVSNVAGSAAKMSDLIEADPAKWANKPTVRKMFLNDVLTANIDRHGENILFTVDAEGEHVAHAIDNGYAFRETDSRFSFPSYKDNYVHTLMDLDAASIETLNRINPADVAEVLHAHEIPSARIMETLTRIRSLQKNPGQLKEMIGYESDITQRRLTEWLRNTPKQHLLTDDEIAQLSALAKGLK